MSAPAFFQRFGFYVFATAFAQKLETQGRVPEVGLGGERAGSGRQFSKIVDRELVYNDELTADSGRLTQR